MKAGDFIPKKGYYENLKVYHYAKVIYDITYFFSNKFLKKGDRTIDQMVQAARSGKQNIAEGSSDGRTSKEMEIKLTNIAKSSLQELLLDYEDYLRVRNLELWTPESEKVQQTRRVVIGKFNKYKQEDVTKFFQEEIPKRSDETIANIAITLIHQADKMLDGLIEKQKKDFLENGGIKEQMSQARKDCRNRKK